MDLMICVAAAVLPAVLLLHYVYEKDRIEKEPKALIWKLIFGGIMAALMSMVLETVGSDFLELEEDSMTEFEMILENFVVVALAEEESKYLFLKKITWKNPNFDYLFDGIVYAAAVSLGFAAFENIFYVMDGGISVALLRAFLSVPGHMSFGVYMGYYYGLAKEAQKEGRGFGSWITRKKAILIPVLLHGFYDYCCSTDYLFLTLCLIPFVITMFILVSRRIKRSSQKDHPIDR